MQLAVALSIVKEETESDNSIKPPPLTTGRHLVSSSSDSGEDFEPYDLHESFMYREKKKEDLDLRK